MSENDWEKQLLELQEAEKWESSLYQIPEDLQGDFKDLMDTLGLQQRISTYKMLASLDWSVHYCRCLYKILKNTQLDLVEGVLSLLRSFNSKLLSVVVEVLLRLEPNLISELLSEISAEEIRRLVDVARFLSLHEIDLLTHSMSIMTVRDFLNMMKICNEPTINQCRHCRQKRIHDLEFRMIQKEVPDGLLPTVGTQVLYDPMQDRWVADDDNGYVFDYNHGTIYWFKQVVDIVRICDDCLLDVNRAVSSECRFAAFHHLDGTIRKEKLKDMRDKEQAKAKLINMLSREREHRRGKEIAVRALKAHARGLRLEREEAERKLASENRAHLLRNAKTTHDELVKKALSVDAHWKKSEFKGDMKHLQSLHDQVNLNLHPGFSESNPVSATREHPYSWQLQHYDTTSDPNMTGQYVDIMSNNNMNSYMGIKDKKDKASRGDGRGNGSSKMVKSGSMIMGVSIASSTNNNSSSDGGYSLMHNGEMRTGDPLHRAVEGQQSQTAGRTVAIYNYDSLGSIVEPPPTVTRLDGIINNKPLPLTEEAAAQKFGLSTFVAQDNFKLLRHWKEEGAAGHERYLERVQYETDMKKISEQQLFEERCKYVNDRIRDIQRKEMRARRHKEQMEVDRIEKRHEDRENRRRLRIAGYEAAERDLMKYEDEQGWWSRYHANERIIYMRERENMFNEELEQTQIDSFWGINTHLMQQQAEIERKAKLYDMKVEEMRVKCIHARVVKPYAWEVKEKVHLDVFTGDVIGKETKKSYLK